MIDPMSELPKVNLRSGYELKEGPPKGIGLYIRGLSRKKHGTPKAAAKKAADNGVSFVAIMAAWQDVHKGKERFLHSNGRKATIIREYAEAFVKKGIRVWIWGFPRAGGEEQYIDRLLHVSEVCDDELIYGWIHDPELFYKWKVKRRTSMIWNMRGQPEYTGRAAPPEGSRAQRIRGAKKLIELTEDAFSSAFIMSYGITSYGMAQYHRNFPWGVFGGRGFGSPQLYSVGPKQIDMGIMRWRELGWNHIIPSVPLFGKNSGARLHDHLSNFVDGEEGISGLLFWSWRQASRDEWRVLARWADWLRRGACTLPI
jgi:hypothetical protein